MPGTAKTVLGAEGEDLVDSLAAKVSGAVLDAADALEVSARDAGADVEKVSAAVTGCVEAIREQLAVRLNDLRMYALSHVLVDVPEGGAKVDDVGGPNEGRLRAVAERLAKARAKTRALELRSQIIQRRITQLEDLNAAVAESGAADAETVEALAVCVRETDGLAETVREAMDSLVDKNMYKDARLGDGGDAYGTRQLVARSLRSSFVFEKNDESMSDV